MDNLNVSRRSFLKSGALLGGGLLISFAVPAKVRGMLANSVEVPDNFIPNAFLKINADNTVHVLLAQKSPDPSLRNRPFSADALMDQARRPSIQHAHKDARRFIGMLRSIPGHDVATFG